MPFFSFELNPLIVSCGSLGQTIFIISKEIAPESLALGSFVRPTQHLEDKHVLIVFVQFRLFPVCLSFPDFDLFLCEQHVLPRVSANLEYFYPREVYDLASGSEIETFEKVSTLRRLMNYKIKSFLFLIPLAILFQVDLVRGDRFQSVLASICPPLAKTFPLDLFVRVLVVMPHCLQVLSGSKFC